MKYQYPILRVLTLIALAVSTALLADHVSGMGSFCGFDNPCGEVADSAYGQVFGVPLSAIGLGWFAVFYALTLIPKRRVAIGMQAFALLSGLGGCALLAIQFAVLHKICPLCLIVDFTAFLLAIVSVVRRPAPTPIRWYWVTAWIWLALFAVLVPVFGSLVAQPPVVPERIREYWEPGRITVVEVSDFECPHCQHLDPIVKQFRQRHDVKFVRLVAPLRSFPNSRSAGHAYLAAEQQGKGEEMATRLYTAESRDPVACRKIASDLKLDLAKYDQALGDMAADAELSARADWAMKFERGLPILWIQDQLLTGTPTLEMMEEALARASPPK